MAGEIAGTWQRWTIDEIDAGLARVAVAESAYPLESGAAEALYTQQSADEVLKALGVQDDLLDIAQELEGIALADDYFIERKLYPNVDFYTGIIYKAMGFPTEMFTVLFAIGRLPGWIAHWREMQTDPGTKIGRPQQLYVGPGERSLP